MGQSLRVLTVPAGRTAKSRSRAVSSCRSGCSTATAAVASLCARRSGSGLLQVAECTMTNERLQRAIELLLDDAEEALEKGDWATARMRAATVISLDPTNETA